MSDSYTVFGRSENTRTVNVARTSPHKLRTGANNQLNVHCLREKLLESYFTNLTAFYQTFFFLLRFKGKNLIWKTATTIPFERTFIISITRIWWHCLVLPYEDLLYVPQLCFSDSKSVRLFIAQNTYCKSGMPPHLPLTKNITGNKIKIQKFAWHKS